MTDTNHVPRPLPRLQEPDVSTRSAPIVQAELVSDYHPPQEPDVGTISPEQVRRLADHVRRIEHTIAATEKRLRDCQKRRRVLKCWRIYVAVARGFRSLVDRYFGWRPAGAFVLAMLVGAVVFLGTFSWIVAMVGFALGNLLGACLLRLPSDDRLTDATQKAEQELAAVGRETTECKEVIRRLRQDLYGASVTLHRWRELLKQKQYLESQQYRREQLLRMNWKALRSLDFERFLEAVFRELGYGVEMTKVTGDQGADLIVSKDGHRIAIQVKGYFSSVSNSAVQEAHTAKDYYHCEASAVITNSRFTSSARDVAKSVGCILIDEDTLPALILGQIDLWQLHLVWASQRLSISRIQGQDTAHLR